MKDLYIEMNEVLVELAIKLTELDLEREGNLEAEKKYRSSKKDFEKLNKIIAFIELEEVLNEK